MYSDTVINGMCNFGIVNLDNLTSSWVPDMFYELWETDALIFDVRRSAYQTIETIVNYIYSNPIELAKYQFPGCTYPGTYYWESDYIGGGIPEPYSGNIILLFNEHTQSHAEWTCMGFESFPGLIKVGSQTAGADGGISIIYVPGKMYTYFTGTGVNYPDYAQTQRIGIVPDYEVHPSIAGIRAGIDEVLAFALDCSLLDVNEIVQTEEILIYPNPFQNVLNYEIPGLKEKQLLRFEIIDIYGRALTCFERDASTGVIDLSNVSRGTYFIKASTSHKVFVNKVVKH
jgi:hypothetical protein